MDTNLKDVEFTDSARIAINELVEEYRQQIILQAVESAKRKTITAQATVTIQDVINASRDTQEMDRRHGVLSAVPPSSVTAVVVAALGCLALMLYVFVASEAVRPQTQSTGTDIWSATLVSVISFIGVLIGAATVWQYRKRRIEIPPGATGLVQGWTRFENALRGYAAREFGESRSTMPWYEIFDLVESKRVFSPEELNQLGAIVEMRNNIVHSTQQYKEAEIDAARKTLTDALKRVESTDNG